MHGFKALRDSTTIVKNILSTGGFCGRLRKISFFLKQCQHVFAEAKKKDFRRVIKWLKNIKMCSKYLHTVTNTHVIMIYRITT